MNRRPIGVLALSADGVAGGELTVDGTDIKAVRGRFTEQIEPGLKAAVSDLGLSPPIRVYPLGDDRVVVIATDDGELDAEDDRVRIGHVRPQPGNHFGGVVDGPNGTAGEHVEGDTPVEAADRGIVAALDLGWLFPFAEGPDEADSYELTGRPMDLPGHH